MSRKDIENFTRRDLLLSKVYKNIELNNIEGALQLRVRTHCRPWRGAPPHRGPRPRTEDPRLRAQQTPRRPATAGHRGPRQPIQA